MRIKHCKECGRQWTWNGNVTTCHQCVQLSKKDARIKQLEDALTHLLNYHGSLLGHEVDEYINKALEAGPANKKLEPWEGWDIKEEAGL